MGGTSKQKNQPYAFHSIRSYIIWYFHSTVTVSSGFELQYYNPQFLFASPKKRKSVLRKGCGQESPGGVLNSLQVLLTVHPVPLVSQRTYNGKTHPPATGTPPRIILGVWTGFGRIYPLPTAPSRASTTDMAFRIPSLVPFSPRQ